MDNELQIDLDFDMDLGIEFKLDLPEGIFD